MSGKNRSWSTPGIRELEACLSVCKYSHFFLCEIGLQIKIRLVSAKWQQSCQGIQVIRSRRISGEA